MTRTLRAGLLLSALVAGGLAVPAQAADVVYEVAYVDSVDGARIRVEIMRDKAFDAAKQPVILTYSPYNTLAETQPADDGVAGTFVPKGYARAVADVLGTRGSTGCWDYGGAKEQQSGKDVVEYLAHLPWSNGRVGMTGVSYEGTTATMVAALGDDVAADSNGGKGLAGILPVAAISRWYGYAYGDGVRFLGNSGTPTDEGFDTPLGFDLGFAKTVPADPQRDPAAFAAAVQARAAECGAVEHTQKGYSRSPDYDAFWAERDYRKDAAEFRVPTMVVHGWQDYNVKQEEGTALFEALPVDRKGERGVPFKKLWLTQETHADGTGAGYEQAVAAFWAATLKPSPQAQAKVDAVPTVTTLGRTAAGPQSKAATAGDYDRAGRGSLTLHLGRSFDTLPGAPEAGPATSTGENGVLTLGKNDDGAGWTHVDTGTTTEEVTLADPTNRARDAGGQPVRSHGYGWLFHESAPLTSDLRITGSALLKTTVTSTTPGQQLDPVLVEVLPDGTLTLVERGFLNLDYRGGLEKADPETGELQATVRFLPQDYTFTKGSRIGLLLQGSNTVWAVPSAAGALSYDMTRAKGTSLVLPLAAPGAAPLPR
ncbi:MAG: Xaa-Pro dipeptidyl-peptidase [Frankiales bacterium]|nr:Xaa-Pro dipeptidyl-peptidase [Frankiales bacterium]